MCPKKKMFAMKFRCILEVLRLQGSQKSSWRIFKKFASRNEAVCCEVQAQFGRFCFSAFISSITASETLQKPMPNPAINSKHGINARAPSSPMLGLLKSWRTSNWFKIQHIYYTMHERILYFAIILINLNTTSRNLRHCRYFE